MFLLLAVFLFGVCSTPGRASSLSLVINDRSVPLPYTVELAGATLRISVELVELVGGHVEYGEGRVVVRIDGREMVFEHGTNSVLINGTPTTMFGGTARIDAAGAFIPLGDLAHFLGFSARHAGGGSIVLQPYSASVTWEDFDLPGIDAESAPESEAPPPERGDDEEADSPTEAGVLGPSWEEPWELLLRELEEEGWQGTTAVWARVDSFEEAVSAASLRSAEGAGTPPRFREIPLQPGARLHAARRDAIEVTWEAGIRAVRIEASAPFDVLTPQKRESPSQLIIDLKGLDTGHANGRMTAPVNDVVVRGLRLAQYDVDVVRLVIELETLVGIHQIERSDDGTGAVFYINQPIHNIEAQFQEFGGTLRIDIPGTSPYSTVRLRDPDRIVIDLPGTTLVGDPLEIVGNGGPVQNIRVRQFTEAVTRIVLDVDRYLDLVAEPWGPELVFHAAHIVEGVHYAFFDFGFVLWIEGHQLPEPVINQWPNAEGLERLVIDLPGMVLRADETIYELPINNVGLRLRVGQYPQYARLVLDMFRPAKYSVLRIPDVEGFAIVIPTSFAGRSVFLDPGHGGHDPGAVGHAQGTWESHVVLDVALRLKELLEQCGIDVILSRSDDRYIELAVRRELSRMSGADVFISVHVNAAEDVDPLKPPAEGTEVFLWNSSERHPGSEPLARHVLRELVAALGTKDRGVKEQSFAVLRDGTLPRILVELAFISNPAEEEMLRDPEGRQRAAEGILAGVLAYFAEQEKGLYQPTFEESILFEQVIRQAIDNGFFEKLL